MQYLLDTNTCIAAMRNHPKVIARLATVSPADCAVSTITMFELYTGVEKCANPSRERAKVDAVVQTFPELPFDAMAALQAAWVRACSNHAANRLVRTTLCYLLRPWC
jgi:tRNA(fMet)-specific endonuclease VapC